MFQITREWETCSWRLLFADLFFFPPVMWKHLNRCRDDQNTSGYPSFYFSVFCTSLPAVKHQWANAVKHLKVEVIICFLMHRNADINNSEAIRTYGLLFHVKNDMFSEHNWHFDNFISNILLISVATVSPSPTSSFTFWRQDRTRALHVKDRPADVFKTKWWNWREQVGQSFTSMFK